MSRRHENFRASDIVEIESVDEQPLRAGPNLRFLENSDE